ncbi:MAG: hypothetical protein PHR77_18565 [Kiritimatiellae bacterium]|nr:hypothetical protein [Kiritimatiellia bacterium]MDD5523018.1 hypothetical protein [Kiritimatiellia bacterium]
MTDQDKRSGNGMIWAGIVCVLALSGFIFTAIPAEAQSRWVDYFRAYHNVSGAALVAGVLWFVLALLKSRTNFFSVDQKIGSDEFNISMAMVIIATAVVLFLALSNLPSIQPPLQTQMDPVERAKLVKKDKGLKALVSFAVIFTGLMVVSVPVRRYFKR